MLNDIERYDFWNRELLDFKKLQIITNEKQNTKQVKMSNKMNSKINNSNQLNIK